MSPSKFQVGFKVVQNLVDLSCPAKPVPSTEDEINPEGSFVAGEEGVLVIHFHSNPVPEELSW